MPASLTYPGVYIEEIPSGVRTITGVATSIAAFVGRAISGPADDPTVINSFGDFERIFGGLGVDYPMSYAVQDFYLNGGAQAVIVRLFKAAAAGTTSTPSSPGGLSTNPPPAPATPSPATPPAPGATVPTPPAPPATTGLTLEAAFPGKGFDGTTVVVDNDGIDDDLAKSQSPGFSKADLFNLTIQYNPPSGPTERIRNVSVKEGPRRVDRVLAQESRFVRVHTKPDGTPDPALPGAVPVPTTDLKNPPQLSGGSDSAPLDLAAYTGDPSRPDEKTGLAALLKADLFNLLCLPPDTRSGSTDPAVYQHALALCQDRRAMLIVDPPPAWDTDSSSGTAKAIAGLPTLGLTGPAARNAALYFPRVIEADPLRKGQLDTFVPCGVVAGIMARTDTQRGVWKAPAGLDASLTGVQGLAVNLNDNENGQLNQLGINCLRSFGINGRVVWGARTMRGADQAGDEYKYVPVRRLALYIEESLFRGTQWVVFEPNDEPLWAQIRLNLGAFMQNLFRQGAFQGKTPQEAYFVKCDKESTIQNDINLGIVNIVVGFAPLKPAEFVVIKIQQMAGQIAV